MFDRSEMIRASKNAHQPRRSYSLFIALKSYKRFTVRTTRLHLLCLKSQININ